jgi:hypothetical protein
MALLFLLAALAMVEAGAQCTPGGNSPAQPTFAEFDLDGDGGITAEEYYAARGARMAERAKAGCKLKNAGNMPAFETIDLDGDGSLSPGEFTAHHRHHGGHHHGGSG